MQRKTYGTTEGLGYAEERRYGKIERQEEKKVCMGREDKTERQEEVKVRMGREDKAERQEERKVR